MIEDYDPARLAVLVVDQSSFERRLTLEQLRLIGFRRLEGAASIERARSVLEEHEIDIVLVEWSRPLEDTLAFLRELRLDAGPQRRVFMLTGQSSQSHVEMARQTGINGYLKKPISAAAMHIRVKEGVQGAKRLAPPDAED